MTYGEPPHGLRPVSFDRLSGDVNTETLQRGARGNERLTAWAGAVLFVLLAVEGVTILRIHTLIVTHIVVGMLLIGPVALKLGSTSYRFVRYYTGSAPYRAMGPPRLPLRILAPVLVVATVAVFGTGVALLILGPQHREPLLTLHKASFIVWIAVAAIHVLAYIGRIPRLIGSDLVRRRSSPVKGGFRRIAVTSLAVTGGLVLALATSHLAGPWIDRGGRH